jgi:hypothetical protein
MTPWHPLPDPGHPLRTHENALKTLLGPPYFGPRDLWLSGSYHPRWLEGVQTMVEKGGISGIFLDGFHVMSAQTRTAHP